MQMNEQQQRPEGSEGRKKPEGPEGHTERTELENAAGVRIDRRGVVRLCKSKQELAEARGRGEVVYTGSRPVLAAYVTKNLAVFRA